MDYHQIWIIIRIVETEINLELIHFFTEICQHLLGLWVLQRMRRNTRKSSIEKSKIIRMTFYKFKLSFSTEWELSLINKLRISKVLFKNEFVLSVIKPILWRTLFTFLFSIQTTQLNKQIIVLNWAWLNEPLEIKKSTVDFID
jgi:hypothetical protein